MALTWTLEVCNIPSFLLRVWVLLSFPSIFCMSLIVRVFDFFGSYYRVFLSPRRLTDWRHTCVNGSKPEANCTASSIDYLITHSNSTTTARMSHSETLSRRSSESAFEPPGLESTYHVRPRTPSTSVLLRVLDVEMWDLAPNRMQQCITATITLSHV